MNFNSFRRFAYEIHLWLGLIGGLVLFIVCLSGTIYVFREETQRLAEPSKYYIAVPEDRDRLSVDDLIGKVEAAYPEWNVVFLTLPEQANRTVFLSLMSDVFRGRQFLYVDPYSGEVVGEGGNRVDPFFASVMRLHRFLWLPPRTGRLIVGVATLCFVVLCVSGIVLWLPRTWSSFKKPKAWKPGFRIRFKKGVWPLVYDLHNSVGFYVLVPVLVMALTGLCWSFTWYRQSVGFLLGEQVFKRAGGVARIEPPEEGTEPFSVGEMIARQEKLTPGPGEISVSIPRDRETALVIQKGRSGFWALEFKDKTQWDRYRGQVVPVEHYGRTVAVRRFSDKPFGAKIAASIRALHLGSITGLSSKILFFVACLVATSFPLTGAALWAKKLFLKHKKKQVSR